ncbi:ATP-dependent RecD-like DNA helicase [Jeotgalicoccus saudimassiliensis]|uniref:ATP-dependent RecD2 DNA helicase n=1 Tax=Jeotgalicoccus saudimassiliensis TaxID=1461582 RepID=A0A078M112_9STAP|nr:ATP-dependent RecD-like DNA helicase [Jeotgalicoccus saudimassiliensis]CDZ99895.1 ATP-dependent RecD-like DNA helicase [Jeotgalicoccus saudimassiliensis]
MTQDAQTSIYDELYIVGDVDRVIFMSEDTRFHVLRVNVSKTNTRFKEDAIVTGHFHDIQETESYRFTGKVTQHARFGEQFSASEFKKEIPNTSHGLVQYFSSDKFPGIGTKSAEKIVDALGLDALSKIAKDDNALNEVRGLTKAKKLQIMETVRSSNVADEAYLLMIKLNIEPSKRSKIIDTYKGDTLNILQNHPYQLVSDIFGIGFKKADQIALNAGIEPDDPERLVAGVMFTLNDEITSIGHTYILHDELAEKTLERLNTSGMYFRTDDVRVAVEQLALHKKLIITDDRVTLPNIYYSEHKASEKVSQLLAHNHDEINIDDAKAVINGIENTLAIDYNDNQRAAILNALTEKVSIITGGPGTGKTTIVKGIITLYQEIFEYEDYDSYKPKNYPIKLVAPTGRASKRMADTSGIEASTIHRLIGWGQDTAVDDIIDNEIEAELIIIDEMSMVDTWLFYQFMQNVMPHTKLVFVGDSAQLPSVGPGTVFKDLIGSGTIRTTILDTVYRQGEGSSIVKLAYDIDKGVPMNISDKFKDRLFIPAGTDQIAEVVDTVVSKAVDKGYDMRDIQVLAPIYRGPAGINILNQLLQKILNPHAEDKTELQFGDKIFRTGDKVIQLINRTEDNIFNGDSGIIDGIYFKDTDDVEKDTLVVDYDNTKIAYERSDLTELSHAYCTSIHKAQGSEYPIVIMPIVSSYYHMLMKNIIYTGITRAKESLILCGDANAFYGGIKREGIPRNTMLQEFLKKYCKVYDKNPEDLPDYLTEEMVESMTVDPMIGMEGVTPYEFV